MVSPKVRDSIDYAVEKTAYVLAAFLTIGFLYMMYQLMGTTSLIYLLGLAAIITVIKIGFLWLL
jgi:hypothetical protein